jgi:phage portal protein BeeE
VAFNLRARATAALDAFRGVDDKAPTGLYSGTIGPRAQSLLQGIFPGAVGAVPERTINEFLLAYSKSPWLRSATSRIAHAVGKQPWRFYKAKTRASAKRFARELHGMRRHETRSVQRLITSYNAKGWRGDDVRRAADGLRELKLDSLALRKTANDRQDLVEIDDHPLIELFHNPNNWFTGLQTRMLTQLYMDLVGEGFWLKERATPNGPIIKFWPLPPTWVINTPTPSNMEYRVSFRGWQGQIPDTEILWLCDPNPWQPYGRGTGTASALGDELDVDEYASKFLSAFFRNRAVPDVIVWPKGSDGIGPESLKALKQRWLNEQQGFWKAFKPFFSSREIDVKILSPTLRDNDMTKLRNFERDACIQTFGVPPEILGVLNASNRATIDAAGYIFDRWVCEPRLETQRSIYQHKLVPEFDETLIIDFESPVAEDNEFTLKVRAQAPWAFTIDEWRDLGGAPELEDAAQGSGFMVPANIQFTPKLAEPEPPPELDPNGAGLVGDAATGGNLNGKQLRRARRAVGVTVKGAKAASSARRVADTLEPKARKRVLDALKALDGFVDVAAVAAAFESGDVAGVIAAIGWSKFTRALKAATQIQFAAYHSAGIAEAHALGSALSLDFAFDLSNPRAATYARGAGSEMITGITDTSKDAIREIVTSALGGDMTKDEAAVLIRDVVGLTPQGAGAVAKFQAKLAADENVTASDAARRTAKYADRLLASRADMIARTEIMTAANKGQHEAWDQAADKGLISKGTTQRIWIVADDDRLCDDCEQLGESEPIGLDDAFDNGGEQVDDPPAHPSCRCSQGLVFGSDE